LDKIRLTTIAARALAEELEGVPLALVQAGAYINEQSITIKEYLNLYRSSESSKINLLSEDFEDVVRRAQDTRRPVAATWIISFETIKKRNPLAAAILSRMSVMDSQAVPISLLDSGDKQEDFVKAPGILQAFSIIMLRKTELDPTRLREKSFDLHRLVRLSMRNWLKLHGPLDFWIATTLKTLSERYPDMPSTGRQGQPKWMAYLPHALAVLDCEQFIIDRTDKGIAHTFFSQGGTGQHAADGLICGLCAANLMFQISITFELLENQPAECLMWAERSWALRKHILGYDHSNTIETMYQYAKALYNQGNLDEARKIGTQAIELIATTQQPPSLQARSLPIQATILSAEGLYKQVEGLCLQCVDLCKEYYGSDHNETLVSMEDLAQNFREQDRFDDAEKLLLQVMETRKRLFGVDYPETLRVTGNLSTLYYKMARFEDAERMDSMVYEMRAKILGPTRPQTLTTMSNLAATYSSRGRHEESLALGLRVAKLEREVLGVEHPATLSTLQNLTHTYESLRRFDEAETLRSEVLETRIRVFGLQYKHTMSTMGDMAAPYERRMKYPAAEALRVQLVQIRIESYGVQHEKTIQSIHNLLRNYDIQKRYDESARVGLDLVNILTAVHGLKHPETIRQMAEVVEIWMFLGRIFEAEKMVRFAMELGTGLKADSPSLRKCKRILAAVAAHLTYYDESESIYRELISTCEQEEKPNYSNLAYINADLAFLLLQMSRLPEAENLIRSAECRLSSITNLPDQDIIRT
jgi:tetratricopeptide (TPR) repeat protein